MKIPECNDRIRGLWQRVAEANPALSQRQFAKDHNLDPTKFNNWTKQTLPELEGLKELQRVFRVPWQWILVGDDGIAALIQFDKDPHRPRDEAPTSEERARMETLATFARQATPAVKKRQPKRGARIA